MGQEEKKPEEQKMEEKKTEEVKITEQVKKEEEPKAEEKKEEKKTEDSKDPPPPQEIVMRVYMHCEGCARKVRACLKGFPGVEDVQTDCKSHKVVVKGEKADPLKVVERVQRKSHRQVELLSPIPKPPADEPEKPKEAEIAKPEEKKEEPKVIIVVLKVHMHCEACAQEIKKRIQRMQGVENADPDLKSSQVTVKGVFDPQKLVEYVYKRTGKQAMIVNQEPEKKEENGKGEKKVEEKDAKKGEEGEGESKEKKKEGGEGGAKTEGDLAETTVLDMKKNEFYSYPQNYQIYPPRFANEMYSYPPAPQMFSDENPNACSVM
ncbi:hypothetical protein LguiB_023001 [Lonicera macranthoides]